MGVGVGLALGPHSDAPHLDRQCPLPLCTQTCSLLLGRPLVVPGAEAGDGDPIVRGREMIDGVHAEGASAGVAYRFPVTSHPSGHQAEAITAECPGTPLYGATQNPAGEHLFTTA